MPSNRLSAFRSAAGMILAIGATAGATPQAGNGQVVYDPGQNVYWLANANLAGDSTVRARMGVAGIEPNGMMDYPTAQRWVAALNAYDHESGWLGHHDWQLPDTPMLDSTCGALGHQGASFGGLCQGNPLGSLYYVTLQRMIPSNVAPDFGVPVGPFQHMQLAYYWTGSTGGLHGRKVFSFGAGDGDATTIYDSFYYVPPLVRGEIGPHASCSHGALVPYTSGLAANQAVYDCDGKTTWPVEANLAATASFGVTKGVWIVERRPYPRRRGNPVRIKTAPIVGGAMLWTTAQQWVAALDSVDNGGGEPRGYLGSDKWQLPDADSTNDLRVLYTHLKLGARDIGSLQTNGSVGLLQNLQPFFYWEQCVVQPVDYRRYPSGAQACASGNAPPGRAGNQMDFDFTFGYGIQGTDAATLRYFVMVYYPGPGTTPRHRPPDPSSPMARCIAAGGTWSNGRCQ
jgi:hypothetical protein